MIAQKTMIARQALRERHRQGTDRVAEQPEHVGPLAPDQVADLAADQDEGGRDERLERDRRLDAARVVSRSWTTAEIETFISEVSTTRTNIAIASRIASRVSPLDSSTGALPASISTCVEPYVLPSDSRDERDPCLVIVEPTATG